MPEHKITLTANSTTTLGSTSSDTQDAIRSAIQALDEHGATRVAETGHFITHIGDARVVWRREDRDRILVLSIFAPKE